MMDNHSKLEILKRQNPFLSSSTSDPWSNAYPDVDSINKDIFGFIFDTIEQKKANPRDGIACLVLGEAGSGKTHLISRIQRQISRHRLSNLFSYIQPIEDPGQTFRYLLREIVVNLCRPTEPNGSATQFDILLGKVLTDLLIKKIRIKNFPVEKQRELIKQLKADPAYFRRSKILQKVLANKSIEKIGKNYLLTEFPDMDEQFLNVFLRFRIDTMRVPALSWLKGIVPDEDDTTMLGVRSRFNSTEAFLEQEAKSILFSIGLLLSKYRYLLLVCFDRMENLISAPQAVSFGKMLEFLVDQVPAMLPLSFFRGQLWEERFQQELNNHVVSRLISNKLLLKGCNVVSAMNIIKSRLSHAFQEDIDDDYYPFDKNELIACFSAEVISPREVIIEANERMKYLLGDSQADKSLSAGDILYEEFSRQYRQLLVNSNSVSPDRLRLRHTLNLYLKSFPSSSDIKVETLEFTGNNQDPVDFICKFRSLKDGSFTVAFVIDDSVHHKSVNAKLEKGIAFLEEKPSNRVFYIRDRRSKFPGPEIWKATNKTLRRFKDKGGVAIKLTQAQAMAWYAITFLHYKVIEGDVVIQTDKKLTRPLSDNEFLEFSSRYLHSPQQFTLFDLDERLGKLKLDSLGKKQLEKLAESNTH